MPEDILVVVTGDTECHWHLQWYYSTQDTTNSNDTAQTVTIAETEKPWN